MNIFYSCGNVLRAGVRFVAGTLSENGLPSFSRCGCALLVATYVYLMVRTRAIPDNTDSFAFLLLTLYGINKAVEGVAAWRANRTQTQRTTNPEELKQ